MTQLITQECGNKNNPKNLIILLHGYGANADNLINLAFEFQPLIPDSYFIAPNAIEPWEGGFPNAYQWFSLYSGSERKTINDLASNIKNSNQILQNFISQQLSRFNIDYKNLILMGFSQGGMMAMYQGLIMPKPIAGVVSFSGRVIDPNQTGDKINSKPPICLIHGTNDSVVDFENFLQAQNYFAHHQINFDANAIKDLDHSIDLNAIKSAQNFIKKII